MSRTVTLPAAPATLSFQAQYDIEDCGPDPCDYAYVEVDAGAGWTAIPGSITKAAEGNGIDGTTDGWVPATFDLSAYAGQEIGLRIRYVTDGAAQGNEPTKTDGIFVDALTLTAGGTTLLADGAETSPNGWTLDGFAVGRRRPRPSSTTTTTSPRTVPTSPTTDTCGPVRTTSAGRPPGPTTSSTSRTRTGCWSRTGTRRSRTTTSASIPGRV